MREGEGDVAESTVLFGVLGVCELFTRFTNVIRDQLIQEIFRKLFSKIFKSDFAFAAKDGGALSTAETKVGVVSERLLREGVATIILKKTSKHIQYEYQLEN